MQKRNDAATVQLKVRIKEPLRAQIESDASVRGITMNAAIVDRLEQSFRPERTFDERQADIYGQQGSALLTILGRVIRTAPALAGLSVEDQWLNDPTACETAARGIRYVVDVFEKLLPPDDDPRPMTPRMPEEQANRVLLAVGDENPNEVWSQWGAANREKLGPITAERIIKWCKRRSAEDVLE